jgi:hypothetical protein
MKSEHYGRYWHMQVRVSDVKSFNIMVSSVVIRLFQDAVWTDEVICRLEIQRWIENYVGGNSNGEF